MEKIHSFLEKYESIAKSFVLCLTTMIVSMLNFKIGQAGYGIFNGILSALWFIVWALELSLKWEEKK
ncbi:MAG: hypothetical protein HFJ50_06530 [Clostridia bacterium]|jgi:hypothetical protein|nr:hypothetical protein [Clostridia bacterium]